MPRPRHAPSNAHPDLSLPLATEKSPLPAIIVTPSSPSSSHDFSIAFLMPPPKPPLLTRITSPIAAALPSPSALVSPFKSSATSAASRARTTILVLILLVVLVCHVATHRLAARRPHLEFAVQTGEAHLVDHSINWFDFRSIVGATDADPHAKVPVPPAQAQDPQLVDPYSPPVN
ncbi:hypothetical protein H0H81_011651 [Sphagnurus paluster]|uniref:Uncharacterized protein n=1 Tax=Sphagnurus paluster TaxID=117069 RepID=A0A9P7FNS8_9AGAR|nr:hypothetical protein H0H81_011651 [Sphagnurus paluster]